MTGVQGGGPTHPDTKVSPNVRDKRQGATAQYKTGPLRPSCTDVSCQFTSLMLSSLPQLCLALVRPQLAHRVVARSYRPSPTVGIGPCTLCVPVQLIPLYHLPRRNWCTPGSSAGVVCWAKFGESCAHFPGRKTAKMDHPQTAYVTTVPFENKLKFWMISNYLLFIYLFTSHTAWLLNLALFLLKFRPIFLQNLIELGTRFVGRSSVVMCAPV